jgi:hypothetical protein
VKHLSDAPLKGRLLALPTNIRQGWKGLLGIYALAYYEKSSLTAVKSFITLATGLNLIKLVFFVYQIMPLFAFGWPFQFVANIIKLFRRNLRH